MTGALPAAPRAGRAKPIVTVGLPFRNNAATIEAAVRSVFAQTVDSWELLLVDDGSTDESRRIVGRIRDSRVRLVVDGEWRGLARRLNEIADGARGEFLARMDADDLMHPERLERQIARFAATPGLEFVASAAVTLDAGGTPRGIRGEGPLPRSVGDVLARGFVLHPTVMTRTSWSRANRYDPSFPRAEDVELWCRIVDRVRAELDARPLLYYREAVPMDLSAHASGRRSFRRLLWKHGRSALGAAGTLRLLGRTLAQGPALRLARWAGMEAAVLRHRNRELSAGEREAAEAGLAVVRLAHLPIADWTPCGSVPWKRNEP
jgi:glycosyltransferase involved in cell wall biosynthesis